MADVVADAEKIFADSDYEAEFAQFKDDGKTLRCRAVIWSKMVGRTYHPDRQCTKAATLDVKRGKATHCHAHSDDHVQDKEYEKLVWDLTKLIKIDEAEAKKLVKKYGPK